MIGIANQTVFVRQIEIPQDSMQIFSAIVSIEKIVVRGFNVDRETCRVNFFRILASSIGWVIRFPK